MNPMEMYCSATSFLRMTWGGGGGVGGRSVGGGEAMDVLVAEYKMSLFKGGMKLLQVGLRQGLTHVQREPNGEGQSQPR